MWKSKLWVWIRISEKQVSQAEKQNWDLAVKTHTKTIRKDKISNRFIVYLHQNQKKKRNDYLFCWLFCSKSSFNLLSSFFAFMAFLRLCSAFCFSFCSCFCFLSNSFFFFSNSFFFFSTFLVSSLRRFFCSLSCFFSSLVRFTFSLFDFFSLAETSPYWTHTLVLKMIVGWRSRRGSVVNESN